LEAAKSKGTKQKLAQQFIAMKKNISAPIAAILILNTIANTAGATIAGMYAAGILGATLLPIFSISFTLGILFLAEIMPKTIGAIHWRKLWPLVVLPIKIMRIGLHPVILITEKFTALFAKDHKIPPITEDEILALVHLGAKEGEISEEESRMVRNIIDLENKKVYEIMTPRKMVFSLSANMTVKQAAKEIEGKGVSRIPLYEGDKENIIGYLLAQDISSLKFVDQSDRLLKTLAKPITFFRDTTNCLSVLTNFLKHRKHISIVTDEFGGVDGLITLEDLLETMLGTEIVDETDQIIDLQEAARKQNKEGKI
jgi:CBS domain containing-hemolysin-like protein